jgi:hypothetical protein
MTMTRISLRNVNNNVPLDSSPWTPLKRPMVLVLFVVVVAAGVMTPGTVFAEPASSVNLGVGGASHVLPHCRASVFLVEYERMLDSKIAVLGRVSGVNYKFDNGTYVEEGKPRGIDVGVRFYPAGGMKGLFIGGALGYWVWDWSFTDDKGRPSESQGNGDTKAIRADVEIGGRFPIGSSTVSILPAVHIGKFFTSNSCEYTAPASLVGTSCSKDTEIEFYGFLALSVGIMF